MKQKITAYCTLAALALVTACSEDITREDVAPSGEKMTFTVAPTRASQATAATLAGGFGVSAAAYPKTGNYTQYGCGSLFHCVKVVPDTPTAYYWPTSDYKVSFYAYYPYGNSALAVSAATWTGKQRYTYTLPDKAANHVDFMTAERTDMTAGPQAAVTLTFTHRLAGIRFSAYNQQNDALTVTGITILGATATATWDGGGTPTAGSSTKSTALTCSTTVASETTVDITGTDKRFFTIPQSFSAGKNLFQVTTIEDGDSRAYTYTLPAAITWEAGKVYHYKLTLGNGTMTVSAISVADWEEVTATTGNFSVNDWTAE